MSKNNTICGTYVHTILARLLGEKAISCSADIICVNEVEKLRQALTQFQSDNNLHQPTIECDLCAFNIKGRCDVIFKQFGRDDDRQIIIDWKYCKVPKLADHYQLNLYRMLYKAMHNKDVDMAIVNIRYVRKEFVFSITKVDAMDDLDLWGMINCSFRLRDNNYF